MLGRSPEGGHGKPLQYSFLENPMNRGAYAVHGVAKSQTQTEQLIHTMSTAVLIKFYLQKQASNWI